MVLSPLTKKIPWHCMVIQLKDTMINVVIYHGAYLVLQRYLKECNGITSKKAMGLPCGKKTMVLLCKWC